MLTTPIPNIVILLFSYYYFHIIMKIVLLFSYYYENSIIIFILLEVHAFEREGFMIRGSHKKRGFIFLEKLGSCEPPPATGLRRSVVGQIVSLKGN